MSAPSGGVDTAASAPRDVESQHMPQAQAQLADGGTVAHPSALQQDEAAAWLADVDDRRGDLDENGRPWYDSQYHNISPSCRGTMLQFLFQIPFIIVWVATVHYLIFVPYKALALVLEAPYRDWPEAHTPSSALSTFRLNNIEHCSS